MTSRLTGSGPSSLPSRRNPGQSGVLWWTTPTTQPPGPLHPPTRVATHGKQVAPVRWGDVVQVHCPVLATGAPCVHSSIARPPPRGGPGPLGAHIPWKTRQTI